MSETYAYGQFWFSSTKAHYPFFTLLAEALLLIQRSGWLLWVIVIFFAGTLLYWPLSFGHLLANVPLTLFFLLFRSKYFYPLDILIRRHKGFWYERLLVDVVGCVIRMYKRCRKWKLTDLIRPGHTKMVLGRIESRLSRVLNITFLLFVARYSILTTYKNDKWQPNKFYSNQETYLPYMCYFIY